MLDLHQSQATRVLSSVIELITSKRLCSECSIPQPVLRLRARYTSVTLHKAYCWTRSNSVTCSNHRTVRWSTRQPGADDVHWETSGTIQSADYRVLGLQPCTSLQSEAPLKPGPVQNRPEERPHNHKDCCPNTPKCAYSPKKSIRHWIVLDDVTVRRGTLC